MNPDCDVTGRLGPVTLETIIVLDGDARQNVAQRAATAGRSQKQS